MSNAPTPRGDDRRLDVLMLDYSMAREDERTHYNIQAAITGVAIALLAIIATLVSDTCQLNPGKDCSEPPDVFLAGAPAVPLGVLSILQLIGASTAVRTYYTRALEKEIREYAGAPLKQLEPVAVVGPASYTGLQVEITTLRRGYSGYRFLAVLTMLIAFFTFGGLTVYIAFSLSPAYRVGMLVGYGVSFTVLLLNVASVTLGARRTFVRVARRFSARQNGPMFDGVPVGEGGRSLGSYLLLPRPEDWIKWLFVPLVFVLASWSAGKGYDWTSMAVCLLVVEYLVYSARYQWNDIRGLRDDLNHPHAGSRLRLPHIESPRHARFVVGSSLLVALVRLAAAVAVGFALDRGAAVLALVCSVLAIAAVYEHLRRVEEHSDTAARSLWAVVGAGYAVRFLAGLYAAGEPLNDMRAISGAVYAYAFGAMFVLMTWTLEGTSFCGRRAPGEWYVADDALRRKRHVMLLLPHLRNPRVDFASPAPPSPPPAPPCGEVPVLAGPGNVRTLFAPWRAAFLCAALCSAPLGVLLAQDRIDARQTSAGVALAGLSALLVVRIPVPAAFAATAVSSLLLAALPHPAGFGKPPSEMFLAAFPWLLCAVTYLSFAGQSYAQLKGFLGNLAKQARGAFLRVVRWVVGEETWREIT